MKTKYVPATPLQFDWFCFWSRLLYKTSEDNAWKSWAYRTQKETLYLELYGYSSQKKNLSPGLDGSEVPRISSPLIRKHLNS